MKSTLDLENKHNVIRTDLANCVDCYRCVRACPVKAIRVTDGQARIVDSLCIQCGTCVSQCPQKAKVIVSNLEQVKELIASGRRVACSLAPSFAAVFPGWKANRIPGALRKLGFFYVGETAEGAKKISEASVTMLDQGNVFTACPAIVNYVERYRPEYVDYLIEVASPMIAHGRMLKERLGDDIAVVFIGPCAAKKGEIQREGNQQAIDAVLTFSELCQWLEEEDINLANCTESGFEGLGDYKTARYFPLQGGMLKTCGILTDGTEASVLHLSGHDDTLELFNLPTAEWTFQVAEPLFCEGGCIGGPGYPKKENLFKRKQAVIEYVQHAEAVIEAGDEPEVDLAVSFSPKQKVFSFDDVSPEEVERVLEESGKSNPEDRLNCGACGYDSCYEKAKAVVLGMAEASMCMPQMRRLAQQRTDKIIDTTPNGIVILDESLRILHMNPAFRKMFMCNDHVLGREIGYLINDEGYQKLAKGEVTTHEALRSKYGVKYQEVCYALEHDRQYVGIYTNISRMKFDNKEMDLLKNQTMEQAKALLDHQVQFAQEMAHYLGKSTAQSEALVKRMMEIYEDEGK